MIIAGTTFGFADLALVLSVTFLAIGTTYLPSPRAKSICFSIPLPFSSSYLSTGQPTDATASIGFLATWAFVWIVWVLYKKRSWPILLAELAALLFFCTLCTLVPFYIPRGGPVEALAFWLSWGVMFPVSLGMMVWLPPRQESHHRSPLPVPLKALFILIIVFSVVLAKRIAGNARSRRYGARSPRQVAGDNPWKIGRGGV